MNHFTFSAVLTCLFTLAAGVFFLSRPGKLNKLTAAYWLNIAFWASTVGWQEQILKSVPANIWGQFLHLGCVVIPAVFLNWASVFSGHYSKQKKFVMACYGVTAAYLTLNAFTSLFTHGTSFRDMYAYPTPSTVYPAYFLSFIFMIVTGTYFILFPKVKFKAESQKWVYVFLAVHGLAYTGAIDNFFIMADIRIFPLYPYGLYPILTYASIGSFALTRISSQDPPTLVMGTHEFIDKKEIELESQLSNFLIRRG